MIQQKQWYVVYTSYNSEKKIFQELNKRNIDAFLPTTKKIRQWSDRKKEVECPLFPNYLFVNVPPENLWTVLMVNGVIKFVSFEGKPAIVSDVEVDLVRRVVLYANGITMEGCNGNYSKGQKVRVNRGPLQGLKGVIAFEKTKTRLCLQLNIINQVLSIDIDAESIDMLE